MSSEKPKAAKAPEEAKPIARPESLFTVAEHREYAKGMYGVAGYVVAGVVAYMQEKDPKLDVSKGLPKSAVAKALAEFNKREIKKG
jgi:hypothetical protein